MTSIFEVLYCRRPVLNYVCPPVCEVLFSGSGFPVIVLGDFSSLAAPGGVRFGGFGGFRLSWNNYPDAICYNVYRAETDDPDAPLVLVFECYPGTDIPLPPGCYRISAITPDGETALSEFACYFVPPMLPPEVTTEAASNILSTTATLNGVINAVGQASTAQFEWGITLAYGNLTPLQNTGDTFADVPFSAVITGLNPNSPYHYRAIGSNGSGIGEGADMTFATLASGGGGFPVVGEYWTYENTYAGSVNGIVLTPFGSSVFDTGIIGQGARNAGTDISSGVATGDESAITYDGNGATFAGWLKININTLGVVSMRIAQWAWFPSDFSTNGGYLLVDYVRGSDSFVISAFDDLAFPNTISVSVPNPVPYNTWVFVVAWYDPADQRLRVQVNNGAVTTSVDTIILASYPTGLGNFAQLTQASGGGTYDWNFDESFIHRGVLDTTQRDYVWNGGIGRTYPFL